MTEPTTLRPGDHGAAVTALQQRLAVNGQPVTADGWYGPATERAVRAFQRAHNLVADGIAGSRTRAALLGISEARWLTQPDIERAASELDCDVAAIQAVIEVESPRGGYLPDGRVVILFERHVFWKQLSSIGWHPEGMGIPETICSQKRGGYIGGAPEYARLTLAAQFNKEAAYRSCSWGRFQIMGFHATDLGYASAVDMANAFAKSEAEQLAAFVRFIKADADMLKALRARKWSAFAKIYNGPTYAENLYDAKLASAYARHCKACLAEAA